MRIIEKIIEKSKNNRENGEISIAFLGDSVTQGCFEIYLKSNGAMETVFAPEYSYHRYLSKIFAQLYPSVPVTMINAGVSGGNASHGLERLHRDVIRHQPDLTVVCFGLNDALSGVGEIPKYTAALEKIFEELQKENIEVIFMTPNMMNTSVSCHLDKCFTETAEKTAAVQNDGILEAYLDAAKELCRTKRIPVCDCYEKWKTLHRCGVEINDMLANAINHPSREMNWLFAISLIETMMKNETM